MNLNIKPINTDKIALADFKNQFTSCIILTANNKLLLQKRGENWSRFPGFICPFGGKVEDNETPLQAITRELQEELGAKIAPEEIDFLGAYTEKASNFTDLIYGYFWHDQHDKITGCYEGAPAYFDSIAQVLKSKKLMDEIPYLIDLCNKKGFLT